MSSQQRPWPRYVDINGTIDLRGLVHIARKHGMRCMQAFKPNMHFTYELALHGSREQMRAVDAAWAKEKCTIHRRKPKRCFGVNIDIPRDQWVDKEQVSCQP